jgi:endonuclease G
MHSGQAKTPVFVAERLTPAHLADALGERRADRFYEDARVPAAERARLADYSRSGLDRGHMAPAADMPTAAAMAQSFALSNMVPQYPQNNRKAWAAIESATRKYARRAKGAVFVISGPVYSGQVKAIGTGKVWVPAYLYKLVYDASSNRAWAYWLENTDEARVGPPISYEELVRRTGTDFLPGQRPQS